MSEPRDRAPRVEVHEPTKVHSHESVYDAELRDISDTGAAIEFEFSQNSQASFDIGHPVELDVADDDRQSGRVIRHYGGGFAMTFDEPRSNKKKSDKSGSGSD